MAHSLALRVAFAASLCSRKAENLLRRRSPIVSAGTVAAGAPSAGALSVAALLAAFWPALRCVAGALSGILDEKGRPLPISSPRCSAAARHSHGESMERRV